MLSHLQKTAAILVSLSTLLLSTTSVPAQGQPPKRPKTVPPETKIYQQAEKDLSQNQYVLYRVIDRLARANELDQRPWRVAIVPKYDINAFATEVNLVAVYTGILDQLAGDASALACIVAHEMGHHVKRHLVIRPDQEAAILEQTRQEAEREVKREASDARTEATAERAAGGLLGILGGKVGNVGSSVLHNASNRRIASANERIEEIVAKKKEELEQRIAEASRTHEYEADEVGYLYSARAGFEPDGCLRAMNVLAQIPGTTKDTTHPAVSKRIEALKALMTKYPAQSLAGEGKARIAATQPLTYDRSEDGVSLRINSRHGGSTQGDLERLFGN